MKNAFHIMILILILVTNVLADAVVLKNGNTIQGKIVEQTDEYVKIDAGVGFPVTYYFDEIANIAKDTASQQPKAIEETKPVANTIAPPVPIPATLPDILPPPAISSVEAGSPKTDQAAKLDKIIEPAVGSSVDKSQKTVPVMQDPFPKIMPSEGKVIPPPTNVPKEKVKVELTKMEDRPKSISKEIPPPGKPSNSNPEENTKEANKVGNEGIALIQDGKMDEGLALVKKATEINPDDPSWHMNYGSMLFSMGSSIFKDGSQKESLPIIQEAEKELLWAAKIYSDQKNQNVLESQCYFLLGDIYNFIFQDKEQALVYYEKTVAIYPQHLEALDALKNFERTTPKVN